LVLWYGFRGRQIKLHQSHLAIRQTLVAMVTKICDFQHKIGYNLACTGDTAQVFARSRGFSGSANLMVVVKPSYHGNENLEILTVNLP